MNYGQKRKQFGLILTKHLSQIVEGMRKRVAELIKQKLYGDDTGNK
jgi:hypothetical protein